MKNSKRILTFVLLLVTLVVSASLLSSCSHVCEFGEVVSSEFLVSDATCTEAAVYYKSCECGEKSLETFTYGSPLGHSLIYHAAVEPTETANGYYEYWTCATCEKHFYDAEAQHPVADEETLKIPPVHQGHVHVFNQTATLPPMLVTAATCDAPAVYYHSCSCGVKGDTTFTSGTALGHDYVENAAEKFLCTAADCTNGATYYKSCSRCEAKSTETFTASAGNGHTYSETATAENLNSQATCTAAATYFKSCSVCGTKSTETFSYGVALGHNHVENTAEVNLKSEATCVDAAVYYKSCSVCGEKSTETFTSGRSLGHNNVENTDAKYFNADATCTSAATYYKSCSRCGTASSTLFTVGEPLPHTSTYTAEVLANCATSTDGVRAHYGCSECRKYFQDEACTIEVTYASLIVEATHKYAETVHADYIKSEATCAAVATYYKSCSVCGDKSSETFTAGEKASHSWSNVTTVVATCQNEGYTLQKCGTCQGEQKIDVVAKTSCTETYSVLTAATCSAEGVGAYTCSVCDTQRTVTIAKSSHTIVDTVTPATCTTAGYTTHTCSVCNESTTDTEVAALGHTTVSATCTVGAYCSVCDETLGAALGHSWQQSAEVLATCTAGGYTDYECQHEGCDETRRDEVGKNGHSYETLSEEQVAVDGKTCTYQTLTVKKCTVCDHTENDYGEETELHSYSSYITIEATCTEEGTKQHKCTACGHIETNEVGEVVTESYSAPEAHTWGEGQTVLSTQTTTTVYTCNGCGKTRIETTETSATVPSDALDTEIALKDASLSLDAATQEQLGGSDVNLSVDTVDQNTVDSMANSLTEEEKALLDGKTVYNFEMSVGDEPVTNFNGKITIKIPYSLDTDGDGIDDEDPDDIVVWYLVATYDDGGNITGNELALVEAEYIVIDGEGYAVFETDHFSYYTVTKLTPAQRCERFGHNWLVTEVPVTCLSNGYTLHLCLRCGAKDITDVVETEGHNFVLDEATRIIADCEHAGYEKHTCSNCQTFYEEKPEALGHDWNEVVTEATCTTAGYTTKTCNECGKVIVTDHVDPLGHNDEERVKDPTCLEEGYTDHWCDRCNKVFKRDGHREKTGHRWNVDAPDCEHDKFCRDCKNFDEDADNKGRAHGHHYDGGKCKDCDKACRHEHKKHSHDKAPTCGEDGHEVYICEDCCEFVEGNKIGNRPDHNYVYVKTIAATCTSPEYTVEKCSVCNQEKKTESGEMTEHNYSAGICTYCGKSANLFYLTLIESLFEAKGFSITVENLTYKYEKSAGTSLWILEGSLTQIDIASLMLYVDDNGELRGAASVSLIITNGPVDGDTTLNVEALIEDGYVYVDVTSDYDEMNLSMRYSTEKLIDLLLYEMTRMELEDLEAMVGMFETEFLPLIELLIATNEADIENVLSCLVDMIFSYENVGGKYVYVLDYEKLHALNENLSDLTVSEVIDLYFGEGSYEALCETVIEIFNLKISEIPAYVEELGIPEEDLIAAINLVCSMMGAPEDFDIADVFASEDAQTSTVGMMVFETEDYEDILAEVIEGLKSMNIYAMMGVGESNVETLTTMIDAMLDFYEDYISYTFIADANGKLLESGLSINSMVVGGGSNSQFSMGFDLSFVLDGMIDVDWEGIKDKIDSNADSVPALDDKVSFNNEYVGGGETTVEYNGSTYNAYYNIQNLNKRSYILSALNGVQYAPHCGDYIAYLGICDYVRECFETKLIYIREIEVYLMIHDDVTVEFTMDESTHTVAYTRADGTTGTFVLDPKSEGFTEEQYIMLFGEISYELDYKGTSSVSFAYNPVTGDITYDSVHNYVLKETKDPEGCGTDGYELYECENCGDTVYEYYNNNEHGYVVDKENSSIPTECGENGYYVYKCEECGDSYTAYVYKAHNYDYVYSLSEDSASCEDGFDCKYICTDCGEEILSVENAGAGHVYQSSYSYANGVVRSEIKCAICGNPESSYEYCYVDSELSVEISEASGGSYIYLAITPDATGVYELYGKLPMNSYSDSYAYLYDSSFIMLDSDDDSASNGQFGISYKLVAGQTYYLAVRNCHNATICIKLYDDSNDSVISLEEYGCTCGGKLYVKHIFGTVKVEAEHSESESCPIEYHGTSYGYNVDENCNRIRVVYAYIYNKNSDVSSSVEIASYKTGEKAHKQTTNTSNSEWGTMTDKDGNTVDYQKQYRIESCVACGKQIYKYEYLSCYDENGNLIIVEDLSYSYSSNTDELYLNRLHRDEYIRITNSGGDTESKLSLRLEEYYDVEGNVTRWTKIEFVYSGCYVTEKKTDSYGNESIFSDYDHSMSEKYVEEESGTASGTDEYGNVVTIVTDTIEHYCTDCMTSLSKTVYVSTYNTEEMLLKTETLYYDSYANSDTDYGYRLERKVETA